MSREIIIRITIPDDLTPDVDYGEDEPPHPAAQPAREQTPAGAGAQCKHGPMIFKKGTNKQGKDWKGYFCPEDQCKPVWA